MKFRSSLYLLAASAMAAPLLFAAVKPVDSAVAIEAEPDLSGKAFVSLFNGKDLTGWTVANPRKGGTFEVLEGAIVGQAIKCQGNTFLRTARSYGDFIFTTECKFTVFGNSGIQFRSNQRLPGVGGAADGRVYGYQCEFDHYRGTNKAELKNFTGGIFGEGNYGAWLAPIPDDRFEDIYRTVIEKDKDHGWNRLTIQCRGRRVQTWVNGLPAIDWIDSRDSARHEGFFALQVHGGAKGTIHWKNIKIKEFD